MQGISTLLALPLLRTEEPETLLYNGNIWTVDEASRELRRWPLGVGDFWPWA